MHDAATGERNPAHLIVGILNYAEFTSNFKVIKQTKAYDDLSRRMNKMFESVVFAELHWKIDAVRQLERLVLKTQPDYFNREREGTSEPHIRNFYYVKCTSTVDEFLISLLYFQDKHLWKQIEPMDANRDGFQNAEPRVLRVTSKNQSVTAPTEEHLSYR